MSTLKSLTTMRLCFDFSSVTPQGLDVKSGQRPKEFNVLLSVGTFYTAHRKDKPNCKGVKIE